MSVIDLGATTVRYREEGSDTPAILLIHGTAAALWGDLLERLAPRHRVISYDRRGYGDPPVRYLLPSPTTPRTRSGCSMACTSIR